jgi:hypothetical protein
MVCPSSFIESMQEFDFVIPRAGAKKGWPSLIRELPILPSRHSSGSLFVNGLTFHQKYLVSFLILKHS